MLRYFLIYIFIIQSVIIHARCSAFINLLVENILKENNKTSALEYLKYFYFDSYLEFPDKSPNFPKPKEGIETYYIGLGVMAELVLYYNPKSKESLLLKKYADIKDAQEDIEQMNILNRLLELSQYDKIVASHYTPVLEIDNYNKFFELTSNDKPELLVASKDFIDRPDLYHMGITIEATGVLTDYVIDIMSEFIDILKNSEEIKEQTPYRDFSLTIELRGFFLLLIPTIKFYDIDKNKDYTLVPHSKNIILDKNGIIHVIDPM